MIESASIADNYISIKEKILRSAGSRPVRLIAVSKGQPVEKIICLYNLGQRDFGENYVQELIQKAGLLKDQGCEEIRWHLIGHLQTKKVKGVIPYLSAIHSVDSLKIAQEISRRWVSADRGLLPVFIQVNLDGEAAKTGVPPEDVRFLVQAVSELPGLKVMGLMCIPAQQPAGQEDPFIRLKRLSASLGSLTEGGLSMGMSEDYEKAIQSGATHVRIGTLLFGPRAAL